ncbi:hypothetical protein ELY33_16890 [Vreelandella andesensis]|uniref:Uncharacterized protein n=1 Tax=Vreelandella andesensis TaxID=447567 RepID=A0A3S0WEM8_9GAMM|nr:hypothetical protein [Halomonas andesensis]RUR26786.1 hypothetical protein ELY33_16890 [Halomonas andesensis]
MDKHVNQVMKRPRILTLCMLMATLSTLALAGCGNAEEDMPPVEQPETMMEQDATSSTGQASTASDSATMNTTSDPMMSDEPAMSDPGLSDDAAGSQEPMPDTYSEENPGFGEGTDPMPGADENDDEMNSSQ